MATEGDVTVRLSKEMGEMTLERKDDPNTADVIKKEETVCTYYRGGICRIHGRGARRTWKKIIRTVLGPGGKPEMREVRQTSYVCDLGPGGVTKLRQTTLSGLLKTTTTVEGGRLYREMNVSSKERGELPGTSAKHGLELIE